MIANGFGGIKKLRSALLTGYTVLICGWLLWPPFASGLTFSTEATTFAERLPDLEFGNTSSLAVVSFTAVFIGSVANSIGVDRLLGAIHSVRPGADWDLYLSQGFSEALDIVTQADTTAPGASSRQTWLYPPYDAKGGRLFIAPDDPLLFSSGFNDIRWSTFQCRVREREESAFRLHFLLSVSLVGICLGASGKKEWILVSVLIVALAAIEFRSSYQRASKTMTTNELTRLSRQLSHVTASREAFEEKYSEVIAAPPSDDVNKANVEKKLVEFKSDEVEIKKRIAKVEKHRFRKPVEEDDS